MQAVGCKPSVVTFNTLLRACARARAWRLSVHLWRYMLDCELHPDIVSVRAWITAMHASGCWPGVLLALQQRLPRAVGKDPILQSKLCEALWSAGARRREFPPGTSSQPVHLLAFPQRLRLRGGSFRARVFVVPIGKLALQCAAVGVHSPRRVVGQPPPCSCGLSRYHVVRTCMHGVDPPSADPPWGSPGHFGACDTYVLGLRKAGMRVHPSMRAPQ